MPNNPKLSRYVIPDMPNADELLPYLRQIDGHLWYTNFGPLVSAFEGRLTQHLSALEGDASQTPILLTALMTCYHALQIGLQIMHLPLAANVLVPAVTFPACPLAVQHAGAKPVFADIDPETWQLTPATARAICAKMPIHAVMPVAVYGVPVPVGEWDRFMTDTGIPVIIDAAAAFEQQAIPQTCMLAHSFHATKPFGIGEGGILVARRRDWIDEARCVSNFGTVNRISVRDGGNAKMNEYSAAVGLAQLDRWSGVKQRRRDIFQQYQQALEDSGLDIDFQIGVDKITVSALMLRSAGHSADAVVSELVANGVAAHRMYLPPLYRHSYFAGSPVAGTEGRILAGGSAPEQKAALMVNSESMQQSVFGLPFHAFLSPDDITEIVGHLSRILDRPVVRTAKA